MRKLILTLLSIILIFCCVALVGCDDNKTIEPNIEPQQDFLTLSANDNMIEIPKSSTFILNEENLGISIDSNLDYSLSYNVIYNNKDGKSNVELSNNSFTSKNDGFYEVNIIANTEKEVSDSVRILLVVEGTYLYSLDNVIDFVNEESKDWFVHDSNIDGQQSTFCRIISENNGNNYYKFSANAQETTTFNMPLPTEGGISVKENASYMLYINLFTENSLEQGESVDFTVVSPMFMAKGNLDDTHNNVMLSAFYSAYKHPSLGFRLATFYIKNNSTKNIDYCIDNIMLIEVPSWNKMPVDVEQGTDEVDQNGNFKSVFDRADSTFKFYPDAIKNYNKGEYVKVNLKYKIVSESEMADSRGALGSYEGGTLFLTPNSIDFESISFEVPVQADSAPYIGVVFITAKDAIIYIEDFEIEQIWNKMIVETQYATKDIDQDGNLKATVIGDACSEFKFYPNKVKDLAIGDTVNVTLKYKITSEVPMSHNSGALGSYNSGETLFLSHNTNDFNEETFNIKVEGNINATTGISCLRIYFITAISAVIYIEDLTINSFEKTVGLGENTMYFLPSTTGMQSLSFIIKNSDNQLFVIDGGYDSSLGGNDAEYMYSYLKTISGSETPTVTGWFLTHPHKDHIGFFPNFMENYGNKVTITNLYYSWSEEENWYITRKSIADEDVIFSQITAVKNIVSKYSINHIEPTTGDTYNFGSFSFEILYSPKNTTSANGGTVGDYGLDLSNYGFDVSDSTKGRYNINDLSLVIKMTTSEKSVLFLADAGVKAGEWLYNTYNTTTKLKADIVQMAHHGQGGVNQNVYKLVSPSIALFNCDEYVYENPNGNLQTTTVRNWMRELGTINYVSKDGVFIFN